MRPGGVVLLPAPIFSFELHPLVGLLQALFEPLPLCVDAIGIPEQLGDVHLDGGAGLSPVRVRGGGEDADALVAHILPRGVRERREDEVGAVEALLRSRGDEEDNQDDCKDPGHGAEVAAVGVGLGALVMSFRS